MDLVSEHEDAAKVPSLGAIVAARTSSIFSLSSPEGVKVNVLQTKRYLL